MSKHRLIHLASISSRLYVAQRFPAGLDSLALAASRDYNEFVLCIEFLDRFDDLILSIWYRCLVVDYNAVVVVLYAFRCDRFQNFLYFGWVVNSCSDRVNLEEQTHWC